MRDECRPSKPSWGTPMGATDLRHVYNDKHLSRKSEQLLRKIIMFSILTTEPTAQSAENQQNGGGGTTRHGIWHFGIDSAGVTLIRIIVVYRLTPLCPLCERKSVKVLVHPTLQCVRSTLGKYPMHASINAQQGGPLGGSTPTAGQTTRFTSSEQRPLWTSAIQGQWVEGQCIFAHPLPPQKKLPVPLFHSAFCNGPFRLPC